MGHFDFLIDKDNGKPKTDMEYIYRLDMVWPASEFNGKAIKIGTIMIDVVQRENGGYEFTCKETGERLRSNYSWSLAENTPENVKFIEEYESEFIKLKEHKNYVESLRKKIITLDPNK